MPLNAFKNYFVLNVTMFLKDILTCVRFTFSLFGQMLCTVQTSYMKQIKTYEIAALWLNMAKFVNIKLQPGLQW